MHRVLFRKTHKGSMDEGLNMMKRGRDKGSEHESSTFYTFAKTKVMIK